MLKQDSPRMEGSHVLNKGSCPLWWSQPLASITHRCFPSVLLLAEQLLYFFLPCLSMAVPPSRFSIYVYIMMLAQPRKVKEGTKSPSAFEMALGMGTKQTMPPPPKLWTEPDCWFANLDSANHPGLQTPNKLAQFGAGSWGSMGGGERKGFLADSSSFVFTANEGDQYIRLIFIAIPNPLEIPNL